mmetsp:Transcript_2553/g.6908  ORF Transcript_2553/g.6908 Transcript_2553/m.6908 type:complete len:417 (-) Transcript_2553:291-1541(-)
MPRVGHRREPTEAGIGGGGRRHPEQKAPAAPVLEGGCRGQLQREIVEVDGVRVVVGRHVEGEIAGGVGVGQFVVEPKDELHRAPLVDRDGRGVPPAVDLVGAQPVAAAAVGRRLGPDQLEVRDPELRLVGGVMPVPVPEPRDVDLAGGDASHREVNARTLGGARPVGDGEVTAAFALAFAFNDDDRRSGSVAVPNKLRRRRFEVFRDEDRRAAGDGDGRRDGRRGGWSGLHRVQDPGPGRAGLAHAPDVDASPGDDEGLLGEVATSAVAVGVNGGAALGGDLIRMGDEGYVVRSHEPELEVPIRLGDPRFVELLDDELPLNEHERRDDRQGRPIRRKDELPLNVQALPEGRFPRQIHRQARSARNDDGLDLRIVLRGREGLARCRLVADDTRVAIERRKVVVLHHGNSVGSNDAEA